MSVEPVSQGPDGQAERDDEADFVRGDDHHREPPDNGVNEAERRYGTDENPG